MKCFTGEQNSVKAANGTLTDDDRSYIRQEISKLKKEIDSISEKTTFNEIQVLKGKDVPVSEEDENVVVTGEMPAWVKMGSQGKLSESYTTTETYDQNGTPGSASINHAAATIDFSSFTGSADQIKDLIGKGFYTTCCTCSNHYSIRFTDGTTNSVETSGEHYTKLTVDGDKLVVYDDRSSEAAPAGIEDVTWQGWKYPDFNIKATGSYGKFGSGTAYSTDDGGLFRNPETIILQIGSEAGQVILAQTNQYGQRGLQLLQ